MKRALDFVACALFLGLFWPVLLTIIVAIRIQSPGNAIFAQPRVGQNGRLFTCYKLRTMYSGTATLPTHEVAASAVTPLGELLRRYKDRRASAAMECAHRRYEFSRSQTVLAIADRTLGCEATTGCSSSKARHHRFGSGQRHRHVRRKSARRSRREICPYTKLSGGFEADLGYPARAGRWSRSDRPERAPPVTNDQCIARAQMSTGRSPTATRSGEVRFW